MSSILLVDDHAMVRKGLRTLLEQAGYQIVAEASSGENAYSAWQTHQPDLILLDLEMPGMGGLEVLQRILIRDPNARILVFTMYDDTVHAVRAIQAGARGYVVKSDAPDTLLEAVHQILRGQRFIANDVAQHIAVAYSSGKDNPINSLSQREFEVFTRLAAGNTLAEIADSLHISHKSAANIQTQIRQKLEVQTTGQLVELAIIHGIVQPKGS